MPVLHTAQKRANLIFLHLIPTPHLIVLSLSIFRRNHHLLTFTSASVTPSWSEGGVLLWGREKYCLPFALTSPTSITSLSAQLPFAFLFQRSSESAMRSSVLFQVRRPVVKRFASMTLNKATLAAFDSPIPDPGKRPSLYFALLPFLPSSLFCRPLLRNSFTSTD